MIARRILQTRYISAARAKDIDESQIDRVGPRLWYSYDLARDALTEWVMVSDDDPRAETVVTR
jgi:hypothetical protein